MPTSSISVPGRHTYLRAGGILTFSGEARPNIRITPADVGKRVSVRRVTEIAEGRPVFSDAVGVLTSWSGGVLIITRRDGQAVHIAESSVVAGKVVPPAPARRCRER